MNSFPHEVSRLIKMSKVKTRSQETSNSKVRVRDERLRELRKAVGKDEYLYYETPMGSAFVARADGLRFESQYLRRIFAIALGCGSQWNWRDNFSVQKVDQTFRQLVASVDETNVGLGCSERIAFSSGL